jgi:hypothetical protein
MLRKSATETPARPVMVILIDICVRPGGMLFASLERKARMWVKISLCASIMRKLTIWLWATSRYLLTGSAHNLFSYFDVSRRTEVEIESVKGGKIENQISGFFSKCQPTCFGALGWRFEFELGGVRPSGSEDAIAFNSSLALQKLADDSREDIDLLTWMYYWVESLKYASVHNA